MSPAYRSREQYERWHMGECVRCGRRAAKAANWEGLVCRTCCEKAARVRGVCPGCGVERLLPGRHDGVPACRDCAGITRDFRCDRCGTEAHLLGGRLCERCTLSDRLAALLDDGTGRLAPGLAALHAMLTKMPRPKSVLAWLRGAKVQVLLTELADGTLPLTHEAFRRHPQWRSAAHLRDLLMACELLPERDGRLLRFESWLHRRLTELDGEPAVQQFNHAHEFLTWLDQNHITLAQLTQAHIDRWHATHRPHELPTRLPDVGDQHWPRSPPPEPADAAHRRRPSPHPAPAPGTPAPGPGRDHRTGSGPGRGKPHAPLCPARQPPGPARHRRRPPPERMRLHPARRPSHTRPRTLR